MVTIGAIVARRQVIADSQFGSGATTYAPGTWYLGLSTTAPADDGTLFTEPVGGAYARVAITNNATNFPAASVVNGQVVKTNGAKFTFPNPTASWGLVSYWGLFVASSGGIPVYHADLNPPISPRAGQTPVEFDIAAWSLLWTG